jgi:hypothetical protein
MSMLKSYSIRIALAALAAGGALAACGDDAHKGGPADARPGTADAMVDAAPGTPDGMPDAMPGPTVGSTVAITDVTIADPEAAAVGGVNGGSISISFTDLTQGGGTVVSGTTNIGDCVVTQYDSTHPPNPQVDGSDITITDVPDTNNNSGLLKTVGPCRFQAAFGNQYVCISNNVTGTGTVVATNLPNNPPAMPAGLIAYTFPADSMIPNEKLVGSYLIVNGFTDTNFNSGASAFPIISQNTDTLIVVNAKGEASTTETGTGKISYTILNGFNPVPAAGAGADFLGKGGIKITSPGNSVWPAINFTVANVAGQGWSLSDPGDPSNIPLTGTAQDIDFGCGNGTTQDMTDDTCGQKGKAQLTAMIISGRATKEPLNGLTPFQMPTEDVSKQPYLEWQCAYLGVPTGTLKAAALQKIIDFKPTRVEIRVINAAGGFLTTSGPNRGVLLAGHAFVGHTDAP